jgi:mycothiol synthase
MQAKLPDNLTVRPATLDDAQALTDMMNASAIATYGAPDTTLNETLSVWNAPGFSLPEQTLLALTPDGTVVGYLEFEEEDEAGAKFGFELYLHPDYDNSTVGNYLTQAAEQKVAELIAAGKTAPQVSLQTAIWDGDTALARVFGEENFEVSRYFWRMLIEFDGQPPAPEFPEGVIIRPFRLGQDEKLVWETRNEGFSDMWNYEPPTLEEFTHSNITGNEYFTPDLWFIAEENGEVAGILMGYPRTTDDEGMGWVRSLTVRRPWRKRGLGMALLLHAFNEFYGRGNPRAGLSVDSTSLTGANRLYERAGMHVARRATFYRKQFSS